MSHTIEWLIDKRILYVVYDGIVDQKAIEEINQSFANYLEEGIAPVHIISDNSKTQSVKINIKVAQEAFTVLSDERWGYMCIIGGNTIVKFFGKIASKIFHMNVKILNSAEDAKNFLSKIDPSIDLLQIIVPTE